MLSKEKFLEYMNEFKELRCLEDDLNIILDKLCYDNDYVGLDRHDTLIIKLIEESMNDKDRMISTYIYETGWVSLPNTIEFCEKFFKVDSLDSLYEYIKKDTQDNFLSIFKNKKTISMQFKIVLTYLLHQVSTTYCSQLII